MNEVLTISEAAQYLRISLRTAHRLVKARRIPAKRVGRQWRFSRSALAKYLGVPTLKSEWESEKQSVAPRFADVTQLSDRV